MHRNKKILYLFSDTGGGHRAAANALISGVNKVRGKGAPKQEAVDVFAECSGFLNIFAKMYGPVTRYYPKMWGTLYYWLDDIKKIENLEKISRPFIKKELANLLERTNPDVIVSVHPMVNHLTIKAMKDIGLKIPMITVIMDPICVHRVWACPEVDLFVVATEAAKKQCMEYGIEPKKIKVIGLPIDPRFTEKCKDKEEVRKEIGLRSKITTVLLMGGGEGSGNMKKIVSELNKSNLKIQLIVICGRNKKLQVELESKVDSFRIPLKIYGFTNHVPEIMCASDIIISKAGPGAIAEAQAKDLPMIITSWLPGQEEGNVEFVIKNNIGCVAKEPLKIVASLRFFLEPGILNQFKKNILQVKKPFAVFDISKLILSYL